VPIAVPIAALAFSPDGKHLASGGGGRRNPLGGTSFGANTPAETKMWDFQTGQEVFSILGKGVEETVFGLAFSPDGKRLASANKVRDAESGRELFSMAVGRGWGRSVAFSPDGKYLAAGAGMGPSNEVKLFNAQTGEEIRTLAGGGSGVAFSPDGKRLASAAMRPDTKVWVWNVESGQEIYAVKGGGQGVAFSPDGQRLASGGKIWDAESGQELISLSGGRYGIAFSSDGNRLMNSVGGKVVIWDATPLPEKP
jgi:WD40 repeat protein